MLIRSQNNDMLINFAHVAQLEIVNLKKKDRFYYALSANDGEACYVILCGTTRIGEYSTPEKARKVLDMIEHQYRLFIKGCTLPMHMDVSTTFQMPADEEVPDDDPFI